MTDHPDLTHEISSFDELVEDYNKSASATVEVPLATGTAWQGVVF